MKRSAALAPLSREHHVALERALELQRATADSADGVREHALSFWRDHGIGHFRQEEEVIVPALTRHTGAQDPQIDRILTEHAHLRARFDGLREGGASTVESLHELGQLLSDHVRFEERELFPRLEALADAGELEEIGRLLNREAAGDPD